MTKVSEQVAAPHMVDAHVGARIRLRRRLLGMSQEKLAAALGLTFQQVQKYERGSNRISASKLFDTARTLQVPVSFFFEGLADPLTSELTPGESGGSADLLMTSEGPALAEAFSRLPQGPARRKLLDLIVALADQG